MTLIETVKLPGSAAQAWELLAGGRGALRLTPGLTVGEGGRGTLRVVIAGHSVTYRGYARQHIEEEGRHLTWTLSGKEVRGTGRAHAEVRARFRDDPGGGSDLRLTVLVDGRGRLGEIAEADLDRAVSSVITRFRRAVAKELGEESPPVRPSAPAKAAPGSRSAPAEARRRAENRRGEPAPGPGPRPGRIEVVPQSPATGWRSGTSLKGGVAAVGALAVGVAALVLWRARRH
ncbi:MAG TPA: hypothetical protein VI138_04150 [Candidatus Dormibacteraeota bacterium]